MEIFFRSFLFFLMMGLNGCSSSDFKTVEWDEYFDPIDAPVLVEGPLSVEYIESRHLVGEEKIPFGRINHEWERIKSSTKTEDCLFYFETSEESWKQLRGRRGYILVRRGVPIDGFVSALN